MQHLCNRVLDLEDKAAEEAKRAARMLPGGEGRREQDKVAKAAKEKHRRAKRQMKLAEAYTFYKGGGKWVGGPYRPTRHEQEALRKYNDTELHPVDVAYNALVELGEKPL